MEGNLTEICNRWNSNRGDNEYIASARSPYYNQLSLPILLQSTLPIDVLLCSKYLKHITDILVTERTRFIIPYLLSKIFWHLCRALLSTGSNGASFGIVVVLSALWCKLRKIWTEIVQFQTTFLNGNRGNSYFKDIGLFVKMENIFSLYSKYV